MPRIELTTQIRAPIQVCFDLARDIDWHVRSATATQEQAIAGVTTGLIGMGDEVTWRAKHFGVWRRLTSRIVVFAPPRHFRDSQTQGDFSRMDHDHFFEEKNGVVLMHDVFDYESPLGILGRLVDALILERHLRDFLLLRNGVLREEAERRAEPPPALLNDPA